MNIDVLFGRQGPRGRFGVFARCSLVFGRLSLVLVCEVTMGLSKEQVFRVSYTQLTRPTINSVCSPLSPV